MSIVEVVDHLDGGPLHVLFRVTALGSAAAIVAAKNEAASRGYRIKTLGPVGPVSADDLPVPTDRAIDWHVGLVVRPPHCHVTGGPCDE